MSQIHLKGLQEGQSLFEVIVAMAVAAIILTALVSLSTKSVANNDLASTSQSATLYAAEAANFLRGQRDTNWITFSAFADGTTEYCLKDLSIGLQDVVCDYLPGTILKRTVILMPDTNPPKSIQAIIKVSWNDKTGYHEERVVTNFTNWEGAAFLPSPTP